MRNGAIFIIGLLFSISITAGCLSNGGDDAGSEISIPKEAGTIELMEGMVVLDVPEGSVDEEISITVKEISDPTSNPGTIPGTVIEFRPDGTKFKKSLTLSIKYDESELPDGVAETELLLCHLDNGLWSPVKFTSVLAGENIVKGQISGFSTYAIWAPVWESGIDVVLRGDSSRFLIHDISGNGKVTVGQYVNADGKTEAFRWDAVTGLRGLGFADSDSSTDYATCVNIDGSIIAGNIAHDKLGVFVWTKEGGMKLLTAMWGWGQMVAFDVYGSMVVGSITNYGYGTEKGFVLKDAKKGNEIDYLPSESHAYAKYIGGNGTIYGSGWYQDGDESKLGNIKWTRNGDEYELKAPAESFFTGIEPSLSAFPEGAKGFTVNDADKNRTICVGKFQNKDYENVGFVYDKVNGMRTFAQYLLDSGIDPVVLGFWTSMIPESISNDGHKIACNLVRDVPNYGPVVYSSVIFHV